MAMWIGAVMLFGDNLFFFNFIYFLIGETLLYNFVLVSAIQQHESAIIMYM